MKKHPVAYAQTGTPYFSILSSLFVAVMLISNIAVASPVVIGPINSDGAFYIFPLAYVLGDVISEVYGFAAARRVVLTGFGVIILAAACFTLSAALPHGALTDAGTATSVAAFKQVAVTTPVFLLAGLGGYFFGEFSNTYIISRIKASDGEHRLWLRLIVATVISELIDTAIFCAIAARSLGYDTMGSWANYTFYGFIWKTLVEILVLPITYYVVKRLKRAEPSYQAALSSLRTQSA